MDCRPKEAGSSTPTAIPSAEGHQHRRLADNSLADGLQDHLISVAIGESAETGRDVTTEREAWIR
jgi:hypothetical protein